MFLSGFPYNIASGEDKKDIDSIDLVVSVTGRLVSGRGGTVLQTSKLCWTFLALVIVYSSVKYPHYYCSDEVYFSGK